MSRLSDECRNRLGSRCFVMRCGRSCGLPTEREWESPMGNHVTVPVCERHYRKNLWWYKGTIFCRDEEEG